MDQYEARLAKLQRQEEYEAYNALVGPYNQLIAALEKHIASYNALVEKSNQSILRYNTESRLFYE